MGVKVALAISGKWHQMTGHGKRYAYQWSFSPMVELRSSIGKGGEALAFHHLTGRARARTKLPLLFARLLLGTAASGPPAGVGLGAPRLPSGR